MGRGVCLVYKARGFIGMILEADVCVCLRVVYGCNDDG